MKKVLSIAILVAILLAVVAGSASAVTKSEMLDQIYSIGAKYGMTSADKVKLERYISANNVTEAEVSALVDKAKEVAAVMDGVGVTRYDDLTEAKKDEVKAIAVEAAKILDASLVFKTKSVDIYKNGKKIETIVDDNGKLAYTGNEVNVAFVIGSVAVIALAAAVLVKRTAIAR